MIHRIEIRNSMTEINCDMCVMKQSIGSEVSNALKYKRNGIGKETSWNLCPSSLRLREDLEELLAQVEPAIFWLLCFGSFEILSLYM